MLRTKVSLKSFFIFNSSFCADEGEEDKKILYYYPEVDKNEQCNDVGFIQAIVKFTRSFSLEETKKVLTIKTTKTLKLFWEPEPYFWIVLTVNVPFELKEKDKKEFFEYYPDDVNESVYQAVLKKAYLHFRMFSNTFVSNMIGESLEVKLQTLRTKLDTFYTKFLLTINLQNADIIDAINCIQYRPITHLLFFKIVNFMNMVTSIKALRIKKCIFYSNQEVIYSSLNPLDLFVMNEYITMSLFPKFLQRRNNQNCEDRSAGCFVTETDSEKLRDSPKICLQQHEEHGNLEVYRLVAYTLLDVSMVMLVEDTSDSSFLSDEFINEVKYSIAPNLSQISKDLSEIHSTTSKNTLQVDDESHEKYIYFNHKNNRVHASFYDSSVNPRDSRKTKLSTSVMNLLCDLYEAKDHDNSAFMSSEKETIIKTYNDYWLCSKTYNDRSLYLILHKASTLIDIADECGKLLEEIVKNVYFTNQH